VEKDEKFEGLKQSVGTNIVIKATSKQHQSNIKANCIQVTDIEGQIMNVELVGNDLYVASKLGSLRLPTSSLDLKNARTLLERLYTLKVTNYFSKNLISICLSRVKPPIC
jgi:hypothetical protein